ncbi:hypothetical protein [Azohydromonas sediminis]|uniref:hypothetical protein n=1 Tax=Azohydromonas sediminis TaxID=2259674 RepID=UPI000E648632|nr:hypothetical protein [Azohydromonas sediminis]
MAVDPMQHPVFERLTSPAQAFARHAVLHELEQRVHDVPGADPLVRRVRACVERGVPYFAPGDAHYRHWAAHVAELWAAVDDRAATPRAQP